MKRRQTTILDLPKEVLQHILILLAMSSDEGLASIPKVMCTCKLLKEVVGSEETLKAIPFGEECQYRCQASFWHDRGLLKACARAGNSSARAIKDAIFLKSSSVRSGH